MEPEDYLGFRANETLGTAGSGGPFTYTHPDIHRVLDEALDNVENRTPPKMGLIDAGYQYEMFYAPPLIAIHNDPSFITTGPKSQLIILYFGNAEDQSNVFIEAPCPLLIHSEEAMAMHS